MREDRLVLSHTSVDVGPAAVSLEDHLAAFTAKDDLEVTPPDGPGITTAYRARRHLILERKRQGLDLDL